MRRAKPAVISGGRRPFPSLPYQSSNTDNTMVQQVMIWATGAPHRAPFGRGLAPRGLPHPRPSQLQIMLYWGQLMRYSPIFTPLTDGPMTVPNRGPPRTHHHAAVIKSSLTSSPYSPSPNRRTTPPLTVAGDRTAGGAVNWVDGSWARRLGSP